MMLTYVPHQNSLYVYISAKSEYSYFAKTPIYAKLTEFKKKNFYYKTTSYVLDDSPTEDQGSW